VYWRPVYAYVRRKWGLSNEEAKDLTQEFFLALVDRNVLRRLSPERGRFRSYVMAALDNFVRLQHRSRSCRKRGGSVRHYSFEAGEGFEPAASATPEQAFLQEWAGSILERALAAFEQECRASGTESTCEIFVLHEVQRPPDVDLSYEALARKFGQSVTDVRNLLYRARRRLRELVLKEIRETVASQEEAQDEMKDLFGQINP